MILKLENTIIIQEFKEDKMSGKKINPDNSRMASILGYWLAIEEKLKSLNANTFVSDNEVKEFIKDRSEKYFNQFKKIIEGEAQ